MFTAIRKNDLSIVTTLLESGRVSTEIRHPIHESTPLIDASVYGHVPIVQLLLSKGADPGAVNKFGNTALMEASLKGCLLYTSPSPRD